MAKDRLELQDGKPAPQDGPVRRKFPFAKPVVEAIVWALLAGVATGLGTVLTHEVWMALFGFVVFVIAFVVRVNPEMKRITAELDDEERAGAYHYDQDDSFEQFLHNFDLTGNWENFSFAYRQWCRGDWADDTRARLLQQAAIVCADRGMVDELAILMADLEAVAERMGIADRMAGFRETVQAHLEGPRGPREEPASASQEGEPPEASQS